MQTCKTNSPTTSLAKDGFSFRLYECLFNALQFCILTYFFTVVTFINYMENISSHSNILLMLNYRTKMSQLLLVVVHNSYYNYSSLNLRCH